MIRKAIWIDKFEEMEVYRFPFRMENIIPTLVFTAIFSYLLAIVTTLGGAGFFQSIVLTYMVLILFFGSLFVITDFSTLGYQKVPAVSANLIKSERGRFFKVCIVILAILSFSAYIDSNSIRVFYFIFCMMAIPLAIAVLILESKLMSALNPLKWAAVAMGVKFDKRVFQYFLLQLVSLGLGYVAIFINNGILNLVTMAAFLSALTALFRSLGVVIHSNAQALGLSVQFSNEIEKKQTQRSEDQALSIFCDEIYRQWHGGQEKIAWENLQNKLIKDSFTSQAALFYRLLLWPNPNMALKLGQSYISSLVKQESYGQAWTVFEICFEKNGMEYKLSSADSLISLSKRAETFSQKNIAVSVLKYFKEDFPNHPDTAQALLLAAKMSADDLDDFKTAKTLMRELRRKHPSIYTDETYLALRKILNT